jgi:BirA family biotin operon repressor/biotin-[acetyl-CoA-carboxylase] ligase
MNKKPQPHLLKIIDILNDGEFHDGTSLGEKLGISRAGVWKIIQKLMDYGIAIISQKAKGYCLSEPLKLLEKKKIKSRLHNKFIQLEVFESLASTQDYLKDFMGDGKNHLCLTEHQTQGRGRFQRAWYAPFGKNIYLSLLYTFPLDTSKLAGVSLIVGLSLCKTLNMLADLRAPILIKWPNDLLCDQQKLAGILIEIKAEAHGISYANIGIGINVNMSEQTQKEITQPWTSLQKLTGHSFDRNIIVAQLINQLMDDLKIFSEQGFAPFLNDWKKFDVLFDKSITIQMGDQIFHGIAKGLNEQGHLFLKLDNGEIKAFSSGNTTIIKKGD